jgi:hypothetical protein
MNQILLDRLEGTALSTAFPSFKDLMLPLGRSASRLAQYGVKLGAILRSRKRG